MEEPPTSYRVICFDCGNVYTGITVADIVPTESFKVIHLSLHVKANERDTLVQYCKDHIDAFLSSDRPNVVVYENMWTPKGGYRNWALMRVQKQLRTHYEDLGAIVKTMLASQKWKLGGYNKKKKNDMKSRKDKSVEYCMELLADDEGLKTAFTSFQRQHDMSDSLLAARYLMDHPEKLEKQKRKRKSTSDMTEGGKTKVSRI